MKSLSFRADLGLKFVSLLLSLLLWLYVQSQEGLKDKAVLPDVPLSLINKPENLVAVSPPTTVPVTVRGPKELIEEFKKQILVTKPRAFVDVSRASEGQRDYRIELEPAKTFQGLEFDPPGQPTVTLDFEEEVTTDMPVQVVPVGNPPSGLDFGSAVVQPERITLVGSKASIERVGSVRVLLDLAKVRSGSKYTLNVEVLDKSGRKPLTDRVMPSRTTVEVIPALTPAKPTRSLLVSARFIGQPAPGFHISRYEVSPNEVVVQGDRAQIAAVTLLETEPISLAGLSSRTSVDANLKVPAGLQIQGRRKVRVTLHIEPDAAPPPQP